MARFNKYIDIGTNLTDLMYSGIYNGSTKHPKDLNEVLTRSWNAGLAKIIITGGSVEESKSAIELASTDDRLYATVGCHPTRCSEFDSHEKGPDDYKNNLESLVANNKSKVVAVGECGLDYDRVQFCPIDVQKKYFKLQLQISKKYNLPLFLHCRNAASDLYEILKDFDGPKGVVHSFDGTIDEAIKFVNLGYFIGLNGCSLKTAENLKTVEQLSIEKLMIETDCPWCEIRPSHAGYSMINKDSFYESVKKEKWKTSCMVKSRNEPANIVQVLDVIAAVKKIDRDLLARQLYENTMDVFFNK